MIFDIDCFLRLSIVGIFLVRAQNHSICVGTACDGFGKLEPGRWIKCCRQKCWSNTSRYVWESIKSRFSVSRRRIGAAVTDVYVVRWFSSSVVKLCDYACSSCRGFRWFTRVTAIGMCMNIANWELSWVLLLESLVVNSFPLLWKFALCLRRQAGGVGVFLIGKVCRLEVESWVDVWLVRVQLIGSRVRLTGVSAIKVLIVLKSFFSFCSRTFLLDPSKMTFKFSISSLRPWFFDTSFPSCHHFRDSLEFR